jgi:hypothetical protein
MADGTRDTGIVPGVIAQAAMGVPYFKKHEKDKKVLGMLQPGQMVQILEVKPDKHGKLKIRHQPDGGPGRPPHDGATP